MTSPEAQNLNDAAQRIHDAVALHYAAQGVGIVGHWIAASLDDGRTDGELYDTRDEAIRHTQNRPSWHIYIQIPPDCMIPVREAEILVKRYRQWGGTAMPDHRELIITQEDTRS